MTHGDPRGRLLGRRGECETLDQLVARLRTGRSPVLVLRGEAGVGKTALLEYLADRATGCRVARAAGAEAEMELAYAGLQQLCAPMLDRLDALPGPQRDALSTAFGLSAGDPPDRFLVGLAVLSLLAEAARDRPLLCVVDDAQWLDRASAQALAFVARRLDAESVAVVFAIREVGEESELPGLPELTVRGLTDADARTLLASAIHVQLDEHVRDRIVAETRGNPLALLELPRATDPGGARRRLRDGRRRADGEPHRTELPAAARVPSRRRPAAAADRRGRAGRRRGARLARGRARSASMPARRWPRPRGGLLELDGRVRFRHPLVRSAAYRSSAAPERQEVHRALADVTDPERDPDRRAWHRAHATAGRTRTSPPSSSARRPRPRRAAASRRPPPSSQRAAELTPDPATRGERALAAAQATFESAAPDAALELLALAELCPLEELQRGRLERLRAEIAFALTRGRDAPALLLDAARRLDRSIRRGSRDPSRGAGGRDLRRPARHRTGRPRGSRGRAGAARRRRSRRGRPTCCSAGWRRGSRRASRRACPCCGRRSRRSGARTSPAREARWLWLACRLAQDLWDNELWYLLAERGVRVARAAGVLSVLPNALTYRARATSTPGSSPRRRR